MLPARPRGLTAGSMVLLVKKLVKVCHSVLLLHCPCEARNDAHAHSEGLLLELAFLNDKQYE